MTQFDVFNGDADGLCARHQLRLARPCTSVVVTGPKRAIALLEGVAAASGDAVSVLDLSLDANRRPLEALLARGVRVEYFDHHFAGTVPRHPGLVAHLDGSSDVCTGIIVDRVVGGAHRPWAIVAAFGDNLEGAAHALADTLGLGASRLAALRELGHDLAYNAYADDPADLIVHPAALAKALAPYNDPWTFLERADVWKVVRTSRTRDLAVARAVPAFRSTPRAVVTVLPDAAWSRRVRGALANELATAAPDRACAVLSPTVGGAYTVSVRSAIERPEGADVLCRAYPSGGGRAAAGGINHLPYTELTAFVDRFLATCG